MKVLIIYILAFFICLSTFAQDIHFSQFDKSPLNLNPSLTGITECDFRFVANHRNQWQSITTPYKTNSLSFDMPFNPMNLKRAFFGLGILINNDIAGDSELSTSQLELMGAFHYLIDSSSIFSIGLSSNFNQKSINYQNLYFGNQFDGNQYNPNLETGEQFSEKSLQYIDFNIGTSFSKEFNNNNKLQLGIAYYHLNSPRQSYFLEHDIRLDRLLSFFVISDFFVSNQIRILPSFYMMGQGKYREFNFGALARFETNNINIKAFYLGGNMRVKDASVLRFALDYQNINFGLSYDINFSSLKVASNGRGAVELSIIYNLCKKKPIIFAPYNHCPVYF